MKRSIRVYYPNSNTGVLEMKLASAQPEQCLGEQLLLEKISKLLLTAIGSNRFSSSLGSILGDKSKLSLNVNQPQIELLVHQAITDVESIILNEQALDGTDSLDSNQILQRMELAQILQSDDQTNYYAEVNVITAGNQIFIITV